MMPANPFRRARRLLPGPALLTLTLALGAPPSGTELEAGGETGAYHYIGACGGPHNYDTYSAQQLRARYRADNGFVSYRVLTSSDTRALSRVIDALAEPLSRVGSIVVSHS